MISPNERRAFEQHFIDLFGHTGIRVPAIFELGLNGTYGDKRVKLAFETWIAASAYSKALHR